nr:peptidyl-prolyl cis-trans isomerase CYP59 [Ipomoea batatas]
MASLLCSGVNSSDRSLEDSAAVDEDHRAEHQLLSIPAVDAAAAATTAFSPDGAKQRAEVVVDDDVRLEDDWVPMDENTRNSRNLRRFCVQRKLILSCARKYRDIPDAEIKTS